MGDFSPNPSQKEVLECRETMCVIAGAGSGKTGTLVAAIVERLAETMTDANPLSVKNILALTFTEKAAAELRQRLSEAFHAKSRANQDETQFWRKEAARLDRADIGTIHSYALKLVRENALNLGLASSLAIEDRALFFDRDLKNIFTDWLDENNEDLLWLLEKIPAGRLLKILDQCSAPFSSWGLDSLHAETDAPEPSELDLRDFRAQVTRALDFVERGGLDKTKSYYEKVRTAMLRLAESVPPDNPGGQWAGHIANWQALIKESGNWYSPHGKPIKKELEETAKNLKAKNDSFIAGPVKEKILRLANQLPARLAALKQGRGAIDFDDILILARRLLAENPGVRARETERFRLILIDEFQDTNGLQADIIKYLLLGQGDPRLAVFGDLKQSIYRFRGAEVEIMAALRDDLASGNGAVLALDYNYRSQEPLVCFFNEFFQEHLGAAYTTHDRQKKIRPALYGGPHALLLIPGDTSIDRAEAQATALARYLGELFSGERGVMVDDGRGGSRLPAPGDVAVLFRTAKKILVFKETLKTAWPTQTAVGQNPFNYAEVKGLLAAFKYLSGLDEEISLAGALRSPLGPVSDAALLALAHPIGKAPIKLPEYFRGTRDFPANIPPDDAELLYGLKELFNNLRPRLGQKKPVEILETIVEERKLIPAALLEADGAERARAITQFLATSRTIAKSVNQPQTAAEELCEIAANWPKKRGGDESLNPGAIKLMTVHASKGLEFPIVIVAENRPYTPPHSVIISRGGCLALSFTDEAGRPVKAADYLKLAEEEEAREKAEDARLLYVAATRARDHLVFLGWPPKNKAKDAKRSWAEAVAESKATAICTLEYDETPETPKAFSALTETRATASAAWPLELIRPIEVRTHSLSVTEFSEFLDAKSKNPEKNDLKEKKAEKKLKKTEAGELFHAVLEKINILDPQPRLILRQETELMGLYPADTELQTLDNSLAAFIHSPVGGLWHQSRTLGLPEYRELPFRLTAPGPHPGDELHINGRIDLFHLTADGSGRIVDYKFTTPGPNLTTYEIQLRTYAQALRAAGFSAPLTATLYFAGSPTPCIHEVPLQQEPLSPHLPQLHTLWPLLSR